MLIDPETGKEVIVTHAQYEQLLKESGGDVLRFSLDGLVNGAGIHYLEIEGNEFEYQYDHAKQVVRIFRKKS